MSTTAVGTIASLERAKLQLAACGTIANGLYTDISPHSYSWSQQYADILSLRKKYDELKRRFDKVTHDLECTIDGVFYSELDENTQLYCNICKSEVLREEKMCKCLRCNDSSYFTSCTTRKS